MMTIMPTIIRTYSELITLKTFEDRYDYLQLGGAVGAATFGFDRIFNQLFYQSNDWKEIRNYIIIRDNGFDLGCLDYEIIGSIYVHHMNPIKLNDIKYNIQTLLDPEFLISTSFATHNAIHYGDKKKLPDRQTIVRKPNDTCPWKTTFVERNES